MNPQITSAQALLDSGNSWTDQMARATLPILLWAAQQHQPITYKQLAEELFHRTKEPVKRRMTLYGKPAGKIGEVLMLLAKEFNSDIPPLNAIVINSRTKRPGEGAIEFMNKMLSSSALRDVSEGDSVALAKKAIEVVFNFKKWAKVEKALKIDELPPVRALINSTSDREPLKRPKASAPNTDYAESDEHKKLKRWAATNPEFFSEYGAFDNGENEFLLESGDKLDAFLLNANTRLAIEVKASNAPDSEIFRGIFQCVKYRATLQAMQLADGDIPNANAVLLLTRAPPVDARRLARILQIETFIAPSGADRT